MTNTIHPPLPPDLGTEPLHPTVFDVGEERLGRVYAEALLTAAAADPKAVVEELAQLVEKVFPAVPDAEAFLGNLAISREQKAAALHRFLDGRASETFIDFLLVLNAHGRLGLLRAILAEAHSFLDRSNQVVRVQVRSAAPLPEDQRLRLAQELSAVLQRTPVLEFTVDAELIGGLVVQAEDYQFDASVRSQLESLRTQIIEKGSHEIQSRRDRFRTQ